MRGGKKGGFEESVLVSGNWCMEGPISMFERVFIGICLIVLRMGWGGEGGVVGVGSSSSCMKT